MKLKEKITQTTTTQQIKKLKQQQHNKITLAGLGCFTFSLSLTHTHTYPKACAHMHTHTCTFVECMWHVCVCVHLDHLEYFRMTLTVKSSFFSEQIHNPSEMLLDYVKTLNIVIKIVIHLFLSGMSHCYVKD
jgi:hypothetical protein